MARWTVKWLRNISPELRLLWAARLFWWSIFGAVITMPIAWFELRWFGLLLNGISWLAITFTAWDIIQTADVRNEQGNNGG